MEVNNHNHTYRFIDMSFIQYQNIVKVFFDMNRASDTIWKYDIIKDLHEMHTAIKLLMCVENVFNDRSFIAQLGFIISDELEQDMDIPQGRILSVTLSSSKITNINQWYILFSLC